MLQLGKWDTPGILFITKSVSFVNPNIIDLLIAITILSLTMSITALGEEIGWRGYLQPNLSNLGYPWPFIITGVVWAIWHFSVIIAGYYAQNGSILTSIILFTITIIGMSLFIGTLRIISKSIFPAALSHGTGNAILFHFFFPITEKTYISKLMGGEFGIIPAILWMLTGIIFYGAHRKVLPKYSVIPFK